MQSDKSLKKSLNVLDPHRDIVSHLVQVFLGERF